MPIRLMIVDDHVLVREGLRSLFADAEDMEVVAEAGNGREALDMATRHRPDVALLDVAMPGMNGADTMRRLHAECPGLRVLAVSMHGDERYVGEMLKAGAAGYVLKNSDFEELGHAVRRLAAGETYVSSRVMGPVVEGYVQRLRQSEGIEDGDGLTDKEREVLQMLAEGLAAKEIAARLHVSVKTIQSHRQHIMEKLDLHSIAELTKYAIRRGLTELD